MEDTRSLASRVADNTVSFDQQVLYANSCSFCRLEFCFRYRPSLLSFAYVVLNT